MSGTAVPTRREASQLRRGNTEVLRPFQNPVTQPRLQPLYPVDKAQDLSPEDYLSQSPDFTGAPYVSVTLSPTLSPTLERDKLQKQDLSYLSTSSRSDFNWQIPYSSSPTTNDAGLTASTAADSVMSRSNSDDLLSGLTHMLRVDSSASHYSYSVASDSTIVDAYKVDDIATQTFPQSPFPSLDEISVISQSQPSFLDNSYSAKAREPKIIEITSDDSIIRQKAEIPRTTRQQPQRKTTFCTFCEDHPRGFHGEHELRRHIERHHTANRKVWICKESTSKEGPRPSVSLSSCKACRNNKTYGADYNAAAHLRRAHFFPYKNKRGGRGKVREGRGGMGGGDEPPMDELKNWMYEKIEVNAADNVLQSTPPELSQIDNMFPEFNQLDDVVPYNHLSFSIPQESANSYDWNNAQYGADLASQSHQFINSAGSVIGLKLPPHFPPSTSTLHYRLLS
jgi:hypothetical protein